MSYRLTNVIFLVLCIQVLTGCASIVSSNESTTYLETMPEGARCELHGQDFTRVVVTPASAHLPAKAAPLTMSCHKDGYFTTTQNLDTSMDGWIFGNIIFGGIIGGVIDVARGAGSKYPPKVEMMLDQKSFSSAEARDEWYDGRARHVGIKYDQLAEKIGKMCNKDRLDDDRTGSPTKEECAKKLAKVEEQRGGELAMIEERRKSSVIAQAATVEPSPEPPASVTLVQ